jgi:hypothetical protein
MATSHKAVANQNHHTEKMMNTYYVATLAKYALVEAADESEARVAGHAALHDLYADVQEPGPRRTDRDPDGSPRDGERD